ncbi:hypothetical protein [Chryseobacterium sp. SIMBA_028]|uniref:hypothetical protein n=1 Tax=Chryseobacterium sp. SIMBA_028 TaxID=3085771 RepID=UPI00397B8E32
MFGIPGQGRQGLQNEGKKGASGCLQSLYIGWAMEDVHIGYKDDVFRERILSIGFGQGRIRWGFIKMG